MKAVVASLFAVLVAAAPLSASSDDSKTLTNTKGQVAYGPSNPAANALPVHGRTALSDNDWATTGANSIASVTLPDSSEVLIGQNTTIQMNSFQQTDIAHAKFTIQVGKVRFKVNHPQGARADYTFQTTTGQIAVRGTEGDISTNPGRTASERLCRQQSSAARAGNAGERPSLHPGRRPVARRRRNRRSDNRFGHERDAVALLAVHRIRGAGKCKFARHRERRGSGDRGCDHDRHRRRRSRRGNSGRCCNEQHGHDCTRPDASPLAGAFDDLGSDHGERHRPDHAG